MITIQKPEPVWVDCARCSKKTDPTMIIEATSIAGRKHPRDEDTVRRASYCLSCWGQQGRAPVAPAPEPHPWADYAVSKHATLAAAIARRAKVREALGMGARTEIVPADLSDRYGDPSDPHLVVGDSPLVAGFDKVKVANPRR